MVNNENWGELEKDLRKVARNYGLECDIHIDSMYGFIKMVMKHKEKGEEENE